MAVKQGGGNATKEETVKEVVEPIKVIDTQGLCTKPPAIDDNHPYSRIAIAGGNAYDPIKAVRVYQGKKRAALIYVIYELPGNLKGFAVGSEESQDFEPVTLLPDKVLDILVK